ncbi:MAG: zinc-binding dehydrogenase [bacterium]|nr:zinc-binding dehydrogenase [bacterium]
MKVIQVCFPEPYRITLEETEIRENLGDKEILVKNYYTLISPGTELAFYTGTHIGLSDPNNRWAKYPFYPGYASVGEVLEVGNDISEFNKGDLVYTLGRHRSIDIVDITNLKDRPVIKLDKELSLEEMIFARLAAISLTALYVSNFYVGDYITVFGLGLVGNFASQLFEIAGARVIGIDPVKSRLIKAKSCGIEYLVNPEEEELYTTIKEITREKGIRLVIEATGVPSVLDTAFTIVNKRGQIILLGSPRGKVEVDIYNYIHRMGVNLLGAHEGLQGFFDIPDRLTSTLYVMELIKKKILKVKELHTHTIGPENIKDAYELLLNKKEETLGVLIDWRDKWVNSEE